MQSKRRPAISSDGGAPLSWLGMARARGTVRRRLTSVAGAAGVESTTGSGIDESEKESPRPDKQRDPAQTKNGPAGWIRRAH